MARLRTALVVVAVLATAACGGSGGQDDVAAGDPVETTATTTSGTSRPDEGDAPAPTTTVPEQLDFVAPDVRGGQVVGADLAGQDLVIWFWAPW